MSDPPSQSSDLVQIVTALCAMAGTIFSGYIAYKMAQLNTKADRAAVETGMVRTTLNAVNEVQTAKLDAVAAKVETTTSMQEARLNDVAAKVEQVHVATNSMKDQLVAATEKEALARGGKEERDRAEKRDRGLNVREGEES